MRIVLHKEIPAESGLGGGSSDAAGMLRLAKRLAPGAFPEGELFGIAAAVGSDVPFFLVGGRAKGEGYGERLMPLPDLAAKWIVVARPFVGCGTADAYRRLDTIERDWREFAGDEVFNDFERVAPLECTELVARLRELGATEAALSGSGSAVFGFFDTRQSAEAARDGVQGAGAQRAWAVRTLSRIESLAIGTL